jgi:hypothetical protein
MRRNSSAEFGMRIANWGSVITPLVVVLWLTVAVLADTRAERAARLTKLTPAEKEDLLRKKERFEKLEPAERDRLRHLHESLSAVPDADQLHGVLERYSNWLKGLNSAQRSEILDMPPDERIARIKELVRIQEGIRFRDFVDYSLPAADQELIYKWLEKFVAENEKEILDSIRDDRDRRWVREIKDDQARRRHLIMRLPHRWGNSRMPFPSKEEIQEMIAKLSEMTRVAIDKAQDANERQARANQLVGAAIGSIVIPHVNEAELLSFYAALPADKRAPLENLDSEELRMSLRKLWRAEKLREQWGGRGGSRPPGGDGPRGRGGPLPDFGQPPGFASPAPRDKK